MDSSRSLPVAALMRFPPWLWGGNPSAFLDEAKLRGRASRHADHLEVRTDESWRRSRPSLITVTSVAGPPLRRSRFEILNSMIAGDSQVPVSETTIRSELERLRQRAERTQSPVDAFSHWRLLTTAVRSDDLQTAVETIYKNLLETPPEGQPEKRVFANAGVHVFRRSQALAHRVKVPSVWLRIALENHNEPTDINRIRSIMASGESVFASSQGLCDGIYTLDAYLAPLLGALSPSVWCFSAARMLGTIIYTLGQPLAGSQASPAELLHILPQQGATQGSKVPVLTAEASAAAVAWWSEQLNELFGILSDPAIFSDREGFYLPAKHMHALLTVEQLFRRVFSIQVAYRDTNARRTLMFTVLDTLERLTGRDIPALCSLGQAQKALDSLADTLPGSVAQVLLPNAERAVTALKELQNGFFIQRQSRSSHVTWTDPIAGVRQLTPADAAAQYIKILRDSTHGHGSNRANQRVRTDALLTHHDGQVPHDLALLGYLYLLDLLNRLQDLARSLYQNGAI